MTPTPETLDNSHRGDESKKYTNPQIFLNASSFKKNSKLNDVEEDQNNLSDSIDNSIKKSSKKV